MNVTATCSTGTFTLPAAFEYEAAAAAPAIPMTSRTTLLLLGIALVSVAFVVMRKMM